MTEAALAYISNLMDSLSISYAFMEWKEKPPEDYYFVGEVIEVPTMDRHENGHKEYTFILRGFTRKEWLLLERAKAKIEQAAASTTILPDGTGLAVFYSHGEHVPTGDMSLKGIKINLSVQEWRVN